jgi:hypothetical protein
VLGLKVLKVRKEVFALDGGETVPETALNLFQAAFAAGVVFDDEGGVIFEIGVIAVALDKQESVFAGAFGIALFSGVGNLGNLCVVVHDILPGDGFPGAKAMPESLYSYPEQESGYVSGHPPGGSGGPAVARPAVSGRNPERNPMLSGILRFAVRYPTGAALCAVLRLLRIIVALMHAVLRPAGVALCCNAVVFSPLAWSWTIAYSLHSARAVH